MELAVQASQVRCVVDLWLCDMAGMDIGVMRNGYVGYVEWI